jgi:hypothetical protein
MDPEQTLNRFPILSLTTHPFAENARIQFAFSRFSDAVENAIRFGRKFLAQAFLEVGCHASGQS